MLQQYCNNYEQKHAVNNIFHTLINAEASIVSSCIDHWQQKCCSKFWICKLLIKSQHPFIVVEAKRKKLFKQHMDELR